MKAFLTLLRREISAYFHTSMAYVAGIFFLLVTGMSFWVLITQLARDPAGGHLTGVLFGSDWFWLAMLLAPPLLTMRLFAGENRQGTLEVLMSAPITETQVVLAKFFGAFFLFLLLWLPTVAYGPLLRGSGADVSTLVWGPVASGYLGAALVGACFIALGLLCSLLATHQISAAMASLASAGILVAPGLLGVQPPKGLPDGLVQFLSSPQNMQDFAAGVIDTRAVVGYLGATLLLLFVAIRILEARRLRG